MKTETKPIYRIMFVVDFTHYEISDAEGGDCAQIEQDIAKYGVWGFVIEKWFNAGECLNNRTGVASWGRWEHVDAVYGFIGNDTYYMLSRAPASARR